MKILLTMNLPFTRKYGGANKSNRILAQELAKHNNEVIAITPALAVPSDFTHEEFLEELYSQGIEVSVQTEEYVFEIYGVKVHAIINPEKLVHILKKRIEEFKPDWIFVSTEDPSQSLLKTALETSPNNIIYLCHTHYMLPFGRLSLYPGENRARLIKRVKAIITISDYMKEYVSEYTDVKTFVNHVPHYKNIERVGSIDNEYVLMINPCAVKGIEILLGLAHTLPQVNFAVVPGWGTTPSDIQKMRNCSNITFLKSTSDLNTLYSKVSILLMPSIWEEGFGISAVDALARGVPVVSSNLGGLREAKLNTNYQINVNPISYFKDELDENNFPIPVISKQDIGPWKIAVEELLNDPEFYGKESNLSYNKANEFISSINVKPLIDYLYSLSEKEVSKTKYSSLNEEQKKVLLQKLKDKKKQDLEKEFKVHALTKKDYYEVSYAQMQTLRLHEMTNQHYGSIISNFYLSKGDIDISVVQVAINELLERHEILRTKFIKVKGEFKQSVEDLVKVDFRIEDIQLEQGNDKLETIKDEIEKITNSRFDLTEAPLFRFKIFRIDKDKILFVLAMHHIISDGISLQIFFKEFNLIYKGLLNKKKHALLPLDFQYKDFVQWQMKFIQSDRAKKQKKYWQAKLSEQLPVLNLPIDFPRPYRKTFNGRIKYFNLNKKQIEFIDLLNNKLSSSVFITLLSIIKVLLYKYTSQTDIIIGTPVSGRKVKSLNNQIGYYVNMIPLRTIIDKNDNFIDYLVKVKNECLEAYENDDYPFELLMKDVLSDRDISRSPIFDVMVSMSTSNVFDNNNSIDLIDSLSNQVSQGSSHDLAFIFSKSQDNLIVGITYNTDLFLSEKIDKMGLHLLKIIDEIMDNKEIVLDDIELISKKEKKEVFNSLNAIKSPLNNDYLIVERFEEIVEKFPDRIACTFENESISYRELNLKANQLGKILRDKGVIPNDIVSVIFNRSVDMIISILGVLKSGACYMPIDASLPKKRMNFLLDDSKCNVIISSVDLIDKLKFSKNYEVISFPEIIQEEKSHDNLVHITIKDDLAYIIYTSGSTGNPKGVEITNFNLMNLFLNLPDVLNFSSDDKWALFHSISFDFSVWEIFGSLLHGSELVIIPSYKTKEPLQLLNTIIQREITILNQVPAVFYNLIDQVLSKDIESIPLKYVIFGGDSLQPIKLSSWKNKFPMIRLVNMYGITETTIHVTYKEISENDIAKNLCNIGKPLPNTGIYILDGNKKLVSPGSIGELYIYGYGLAKGYRNKKILTKEKFSKVSFFGDICVYKSGDYGRLLENGEIEFLGRKDNQIQIRGYRIEIEEINYCLERCKMIKDFVVSSKYVVDEGILVLYFVPEKQIINIESKIQDYLSEKLPDYMIPTFFINIDSIPLSSNGKINKNALPSPFQENYNEYRDLPSNEIEEKLFKMWEDVLCHENFGIDSDFFTIGGHSLKAAKITHMIYKEFEIDIGLGVFFDKPNIRKLAQYIDVITYNSDNDDLELNENEIII
ncbi:amino acid adenylation domain-containing protein [Aquimarina algiphila]|uniref:amino acid adenylation domain-containing protein n=1 Tax=Aquimarina algiphila TaxID=2047982 RepID=UPI00232C24B7|nr:amino acid adenylation domain-containing protein [Aquimarina algiphila]